MRFFPSHFLISVAPHPHPPSTAPVSGACDTSETNTEGVVTLKCDSNLIVFNLLYIKQFEGRQRKLRAKAATKMCVCTTPKTPR